MTRFVGQHAEAWASWRAAARPHASAAAAALSPLLQPGAARCGCIQAVLPARREIFFILSFLPVPPQLLWLRILQCTRLSYFEVKTGVRSCGQVCMGSRSGFHLTQIKTLPGPVQQGLALINQLCANDL